MPKKPTGNPNGRPKTKIDKDQFEKLCGLQCTQEEIAGFFNCSIDTITNWCKSTYGCTFSDTYKIYSQSGKISLRRMQLKLAEHSAAMAIFLGKQILGQRDVQNIVLDEDAENKELMKKYLDNMKK